MAERFRDTSADVTLYVGPERVAVPAHSQLLALGSDFFDAALGSGMRESQSKCIELPDQDPDDILLLLDYISPRSEVMISAENVLTLIPLFHQFQCTTGLNAADEFCARDDCMDWTCSALANTVGSPVDMLMLSVDYDLLTTRDSALWQHHKDITPDTCADSDVYEYLTHERRLGPHRNSEGGMYHLQPRLTSKYVRNHQCFCRLEPLVCDARYAEVMSDVWPIIRSLVLTDQQQVCSCQPSTASSLASSRRAMSCACPDRRRRI